MSQKAIKFIVIAGLAVLLIAGALGAKAVVSSGAGNGTQNGFQQAKQKYLDEVNASQNFKKSFDAIKVKLDNLKTHATSTQELTNLKEQFQQKAGDFLKTEISAMIKYLEALKNKVTNMQKMDEGDRASILANINKNIAWLQGRQAEIDGASADKLKTISQEVKDYWTNIRVSSRRVTGQVLASRIKFLIDKAELMSQKLETKIQELKQAGKDTAKLEQLLADFKTKISSAKDSYQQAKDKFQAISSKDNIVQLYQDGKNLVRDGNQYLKQAYQDLVQMVRIIKQLGGAGQSGNATITP